MKMPVESVLSMFKDGLAGRKPFLFQLDSPVTVPIRASLF